MVTNGDTGIVWSLALTFDGMVFVPWEIVRDKVVQEIDSTVEGTHSWTDKEKFCLAFGARMALARVNRITIEMMEGDQ